jgi:hypothetical protein
VNTAVMVNNFLDFLKKRPEGDDGALFFNNWVQGRVNRHIAENSF